MSVVNGLPVAAGVLYMVVYWGPCNQSVCRCICIILAAIHAVLCLQLAEREIKMEGNTNQTRAYDGGQSTCSESLIHADQSQTTYWGVLCRTCHELVAFDVCPYISFGSGAASMKPGTIRCSQDHTHIYFPRDFGFIPSIVPVCDETMRENRATYAAINLTKPVSSYRNYT